jgi:hypothetical protein
MGKIIAKHQITNGGSVILYQPENEYSGAVGVKFPNADYMQYVEDQARKAGIVVPFISNDASAGGRNAPGTGKGAVDIYGHDGYPLGFDCANPNTWPAKALPTNWRTTHLNQSASTPYTIPEFQGGSFDPWGGWGFDQCLQLINHEQERVFYKNNYAAGVTIFNLYMIFGGTNWGNLGHPGGYTSYDYAAPIAEDRTVSREKYSELKLEAQFLKVSPGYLTATPGNRSVTGIYSPSTAVSITPLSGPNGSFYVARHTDYQSTESTAYTLTLPTSAGNITIPQLGGSLTLGRRDSKIHVSDYPLGDHALLYSTAEIFTWKKFEEKTVLVVYGGPGEQHELAIKSPATDWKADCGLAVASKNGNVVVNWHTSTKRRVFQLGDLHVYIVDRNSAYNYWVPETSSSSSVIVNGGYLIRSATISGSTLNLRGDFNSTSAIEVIGVPKGVSTIKINDVVSPSVKNAQGNWESTMSYVKPTLPLPKLSELDWKSINSLPEIKPGYDDSNWVTADHKTTNNTFVQPLRTPTSLFASDYGFHTGALLYRGHFTASGAEKSVYLSTQGGSAFGSSVWLNETFLGSWAGTDASAGNNATYALPNLAAGKPYVLTVLIDNMGLNENWVVGVDEMKNARGILDYKLVGSSSNATVTWKLTGNLGGEDYADKARGPLNEGGLYVERQGYHLPSPPLEKFSPSAGPTAAGLDKPGVAFYVAQLPLALPSETYDIPLSFVFENSTAAASSSADTGAAGGVYRAWLYVNGFQFGRYVSNVGPQTVFPVPEGILNYKGDNWIGLAVWAVEVKGAKVPGFELKAGTPVVTGRDKVEVVDAPGWTTREGAY